MTTPTTPTPTPWTVRTAPVSGDIHLVGEDHHAFAKVYRTNNGAARAARIIHEHTTFPALVAALERVAAKRADVVKAQNAGLMQEVGLGILQQIDAALALAKKEDA